MTDDQQRALVAQRESKAIADEIAELRRDAERYQWIRTSARIDSCGRGKRTYPVSFMTVFAKAPKEGGNYRERFDAAVDAAMREGE